MADREPDWSSEHGEMDFVEYEVLTEALYRFLRPPSGRPGFTRGFEQNFSIDRPN